MMVISRRYVEEQARWRDVKGDVNLNFLQGTKWIPILCGRRTALNDGCV